jgi:Uma2 family endonuclease
MQAPAILPYSEYRKLPDDDPNQYEMMWGVLYVSPSARFKHQRIQARLVRLLGNYVDRHDLGTIVEPIDLYRDEVNYVEPDISYFTSDQSVQLEEEQTIRLVPPLVVELLSPSTARKDRETKRRWYADLGVREYWIVDCEARAVEVIDLQNDTSTQTDPVRSGVLVGLSHSLRQIFG